MLEITILSVGVILIIVALLMLFLDAYKHNKFAAIISLLLIFPLIGYLLFNLNLVSVRNAASVLIVGIVAIIVSIFGGVSEHIPYLQKSEVVQKIEKNIAPKEAEPLPNEEEAQATELANEAGYDPLLTGSEFEEVEIEEIVPGQNASNQASGPT